ncbi:hypothetical protein [Endozoicomonas lisbonensis]|uniref:Uncharacterized protein n=1 Tax=Endozoicomonas lisbonensis TaxID=3120522 RepID=A0ABV2SHL4_9GAMM
MKYRTLPIVSLFATFPALAFDSGFGSVMPSGGLEFSTPEVGFIRKDTVLADSIADITTSRVMPELQQTQQVALPLNGISAQLFRYTNGKQSLSFKLSGEYGTVPPESGQQNASDYQSRLLKIAEPVANNKLKVLFDEVSSNFILSATTKTAYRIKVPSRVDRDDYPEGVLTGFTMLHRTSLKDMTSAWSCYENAGYFFYSTVICDDGSHLSWNKKEKLYVYQAADAAPFPSPPDFSFGWQQFGFDESWFLSDEYLLLTRKGEPVKISVIGEISSKEEPVDGNSSSKNEGSDSRESSAASSDTKQSPPSVTAEPKGSSYGSAGGNEPPRRPVKYEKKEPEEGVAPNKTRKKRITKVAKNSGVATYFPSNPSKRFELPYSAVGGRKPRLTIPMIQNDPHYPVARQYIQSVPDEMAPGTPPSERRSSLTDSNSDSESATSCDDSDQSDQSDQEQVFGTNDEDAILTNSKKSRIEKKQKRTHDQKDGKERKRKTKDDRSNKDGKNHHKGKNKNRINPQAQWEAEEYRGSECAEDSPDSISSEEGGSTDQQQSQPEGPEQMSSFLEYF